MTEHTPTCDYCGDTPIGPDESGDSRFCHTCLSDPFRSALIRVQEAIGAPHHIVREINTLTTERDKLRAINKELVVAVDAAIDVLATLQCEHDELNRDERIDIVREAAIEAMVTAGATVTADFGAAINKARKAKAARGE